ncbi:hypothetical protein SLEP1_g18191 [Rubroshorea leprosula]|uniref:Uncharacterized protein n=1 Tax=Rubroshorea leprosula TaxID=152421 RepID=A0AAV5IWP4_9ROSI|nr:hypothetical protein SLEP1_g18191 [Rubroshorea leprosula]
MLLIEPVRLSDPASGGYTPANSALANGRIHCFSLSTISRSETEDGKTTGSDELEG